MKTIRAICVVGLMMGLGWMGGCAGETKSEWVTLNEGSAPSRLRPLMEAADWRAVSYLAQKGYEEPVRALNGYDKAYMEGTLEGKKILSVIYTKRTVGTDAYVGMSHFRVIVDENRESTLIEGG